MDNDRPAKSEQLRRPKNLDPHGGGIRIRIRHKGKTHQEILPGNFFNARDLAAAERRRDEINARLRLGLPVNPGDASENNIFLQDAQDYLNALDVDYSTSLDYEGILNKHWLPLFGNRISREIPTKDIKTALNKTGLSQKRKRNLLIPLRGVFDHAGVKPNPAAIKIKKGQKPKVQRFLPEERAAIMSAIDGMGDPQISAYFALLFGCGLRPSGEPLGLKWADWDGKKLHIHRTIVRRRFTDTKTHEARRVYVPKWVHPYIKALPSRFKGEWLFLNSQGNHYRDSDTFNATWQAAFETKRIKRDLKLEYRIPYVCRHTRAAELLSTGVEPAKAAKELGHTLEMFFRTYSEWIDEYAQSSDDELEGYRERFVPDLSSVEE